MTEKKPHKTQTGERTTAEVGDEGGSFGEIAFEHQVVTTGSEATSTVDSDKSQQTEPVVHNASKKERANP